MEKIGEQSLIKLVELLQIKRISTNLISCLCNVDKLSELTTKQYNYLLYLLCLRE